MKRTIALLLALALLFVLSACGQEAPAEEPSPEESSGTVEETPAEEPPAQEAPEEEPAGVNTRDPAGSG